MTGAAQVTKCIWTVHADRTPIWRLCQHPLLHRPALLVSVRHWGKLCLLGICGGMAISKEPSTACASPLQNPGQGFPESLRLLLIVFNAGSIKLI